MQARLEISSAPSSGVTRHVAGDVAGGGLDGSAPYQEASISHSVRAFQTKRPMYLAKGSR